MRLSSARVYSYFYSSFGPQAHNASINTIVQWIGLRCSGVMLTWLTKSIAIAAVFWEPR